MTWVLEKLSLFIETVTPFLVFISRTSPFRSCDCEHVKALRTHYAESAYVILGGASTFQI